jgi:hypothetical protein
MIFRKKKIFLIRVPPFDFLVRPYKIFFCQLKVHPWVNFQSMLEKCLVGNYIQPATTADLKPKNTKLQIPITNLTLNHGENGDKYKIPSLDTYQSLDKVTLVFYTKFSQLINDYVIIYRDERTDHLIIDIYLFDYVFEYKIGN